MAQGKPVITIKKVDKAVLSYGDHASYGREPARYGVFKNGKQVGFIYSERQTYMNTPGWWELAHRKGGKTIKRFYTSQRQGGAFTQAKKFALNYKW